ncbi:hypothetical protein QUF58_07010 [Anaerolineales bacterium HSG24]|nr:hypothetical protein [Anaerolineales bacterium HSG24]
MKSQPALYPIQYALFLFLLASYLLTYTPRINASDGLAMFATAESLVRHGSLPIEQIRWMGLQQGTFGLDGLLYSRKGIGVPLGMLPLTWLGFMLPNMGMVSVSLLFNALVTTTSAVLLMSYLCRLGYHQATSLLVALSYGLSTLAWPYAKSLFSDPFAGLMLLSAAYSLLRFRQSTENTGTLPASSLPQLGWTFLASLWLAWNVASRYAEAIFIPLFGLYLLWSLHQKMPLLPAKHSPARKKTYFAGINPTRFSPWLPSIIAFILPLATVALLLFSFNYSRYGHPLNTGYLPNETFSGILGQGIAGQLISPGRGLFLYCPILLLSIVGLRPFWRRFPAESLLAVSIIGLHLLLYGKWFMWHGGYAWGPRFLIPTLPFWAMFLAPVAALFKTDSSHDHSHRDAEKNIAHKDSTNLNQCLSTSFILIPYDWLLRPLYVGLFLLGLIPQLLSVAIDFAPFQNSLLDGGLPLFAPQTFFEWTYSPFVGAWRFISLDSLDVAWLWQGQLNMVLLFVLLSNLFVTSVNLFLTSRHTYRLNFMATILMIVSLNSLLVHTHQLPSDILKQVTTILNQDSQADDLIINNQPELTMPLAELYKGQAEMLGIQQAGLTISDELDSRLDQLINQHEQIWWLPNWIPATESGVEQKLLTKGFRVREDWIDEQRLVLFALPTNIPEHARPQSSRFADIRLTNLVYSPTGQAGHGLPIQFTWQADQPLTEDYHLFIHLIDSTGAPIAQTDGQPVNWSRPTSTWPPNEPIIDRHALWLPANTPSGPYTLRVGWYHPADGARLPLSDGTDALELLFEVR